jgi:hypothetical protein
VISASPEILSAELPPLRWERDFRFDDRQLAKLAGAPLPSRVEDLLDIAAACYLIDRLVSRHPHDAGPPDGSHWERTLPLTVPVREPEFWGNSAVRTALGQLLSWLTDDNWEIEFRANREVRRYAEAQAAFDGEPPAVAVGLFSGGLDSLLGAAVDLQAADGPLALVSVATNARLYGLQRTLIKGLGAGYDDLRWASVGLALRRDYLRRSQLSRRSLEGSQRTRGFVFLSAGAAAAIASGVPELRVYENGPGAVNLPLNRAQRGSQSTRAMHPKTLQLAGRLFSLVADGPFGVVNCRFWTTKAQMCETASPETLALIPYSVSCDTGLTSRRSAALCGRCTSCLLRRQALQASQLHWADALDRDHMRVDVRDMPSRKTVELHWMLEQAARLSGAVHDRSPEQALLHVFPQLGWLLETTPRERQPAVLGRLVDLYTRYVGEWHSFDSPLVHRYLPETEGS